MNQGEIPVLSVENVAVTFGSGATATHALKNVSLQLHRGESVGLVGESGSGKSTLAKVLTGTYGINSGRVMIAEHELSLRQRKPPEDRTMLQMIPQDPYSSLSPRRTAGQTIAEALDPQNADLRKHRNTVMEWLERVELPPDSVNKYPHEFSGGQRQRIAIARTLCISPKIVIADEITSALDISVQAEVLELLSQLRRDLELTMIFISHNLAVVRHVSDRVVVLFHGEVMEDGDVERVFRNPEADYTRRLLDSVPGRPGFNVRPDRIVSQL